MAAWELKYGSQFTKQTEVKYELCGYWNMSDFKSKPAWRDEVYVILIKKTVYQEVVTV